jgi:hypothetical protein
VNWAEIRKRFVALRCYPQQSEREIREARNANQTRIQSRKRSPCRNDDYISEGTTPNQKLTAWPKHKSRDQTL